MFRAVCRALTIGLTFLMLLAALVDVFAQCSARRRPEPPQSRTPPRVLPAPPTIAPLAGPSGTLEIRAQPTTAELLIDGERWVSSEPGRFVVQLPAGSHRVEMSELGYQRFVSDVLVRDGQAATLNTTLVPATRE